MDRVLEAKKAALTELRRCCGNPDTEAAHVDADDALMEFVRALGFDDVAAEYDRVKKWYS